MGILFGNKDGDLQLRAIEKPGIRQVSILFSVVIFLFVMLGFRVQRNEFYSGILITELVLIMLPAVIFLLLFKYDPRYVLRLNKTGVLNFLLIFCIMIFAIPLAGIFNVANLWLVNSIFGKVLVAQPPIATDSLGLLINILVIGGSAGICEEFLFRGVIQRGFERFGAVPSILMAAFLFSITHLDFQKVFGTFALGVLIGFIVYKTNSLYAGMFAHFTNNSLAVLIGFTVTKVMELMEKAGFSVPDAEADLSSAFETFSRIPRMQLMMVVFVYGFIFLVIAMIFAALIFAFIKVNKGKAETMRVSGKASTVMLLWVIPGLVLIMGVYILQVAQFRGADSWLLQLMRSIVGA